MIDFFQLREKAVSQAQQKMMGMALAYKRGEMDDASPEVKKMADSMSMKDLEDFAKTKHKGLPVKKESVDLDEAFTPKEIKMAIGVASDKRYAGGNMTGAVNAIEKIKKGLSDHPQVKAVLKRQNESLDESRMSSDAYVVAVKDPKGWKVVFSGSKKDQSKEIKKMKADGKVIGKDFRGYMSPRSKVGDIIKEYGGPKISRDEYIKKGKEYHKEEQDPLLADENPVTENGQDFFQLREKLSEQVLVHGGNLHEKKDSYPLYHKTYSDAMAAAYAYAKKQGYEVDMDDVDRKVASGPRKPSNGKTNSFTLKLKGEKRKMLAVQVTNLDNKRYELNTYIT